MLITVFWFAGSIALAAGLPGLKDDTSPLKYMKSSYICSHENVQCDIAKEPNYATLKVSIVSLQVTFYTNLPIHIQTKSCDIQR